MAVNDSDQVVGHAQASGGHMHAFLWNGGALQDLGTLGGGSSYAYGINNSGDVVGYSSLLACGDPHAFLYQGGAMLDLNDMIDPTTGWIFTQAFAMNDAGQIVGSGLLNGVEHAFRLDRPQVTTLVFAESNLAQVSGPEPSSLWPGLGGLAALGVTQAYRRRLFHRLLPPR